MEFRDLKAQYHVLREQIDKAVQQVVASGAYINGPAVAQLEQELKVYVGMDQCITCGNGTDALHLALMALGAGPGDAVFVPAFTFFASAEVIALVGARPVFVDVDARTFNIDPAALADAYQALVQSGAARPVGIVTVDLFGLPAPYPQVHKFAQTHGLWVVEDAAQGFGGAIDGRKACSLGELCCTSFFPAKPLGCYGDGGAVFTNDRQLAQLVDSYRVHGRGTNKYDNVRIGVNSRLDTLQAAILRVKLEALQGYELGRLQQVAAQYDAQLRGLVKVPYIPEGYSSSWAQYTIKLPDAKLRPGLQEHLKQHGVPSMVYYPKPLHLQEAFKYLGYQVGSFPVSERLCTEVLSLPMHPYLEPEEVTKVCGLVRDYLQ